MKKFTLIALVLLLAISLLALASCNGTGSKEETTIEAHVHSFGEWTATKDATCTAAGEQTRTCACGEKETQSTSMLEHSFDDWRTVIEVKCEEDGLSQRFCSVCNYTESKTIETTGHTEVVDEAVAPT